MKEFVVRMASAASDVFVSENVKSIMLNTTFIIVVKANTPVEAAVMARNFTNKEFFISGRSVQNLNLGVQEVMDVETINSNNERKLMPERLAVEMSNRLNVDIPVRLGQTFEGFVFGCTSDTHCIVITFKEDDIRVYLHRQVEGDENNGEILVDKKYDYPVSDEFLNNIEDHLAMMFGEWGDDG